MSGSRSARQRFVVAEACDCLVVTEERALLDVVGRRVGGRLGFARGMRVDSEVITAVATSRGEGDQDGRSTKQNSRWTAKIHGMRPGSTGRACGRDGVYRHLWR
jgi:hypothetical protein